MNARNALYSELMWPQWNSTTGRNGTSDEQAEQLLDTYRDEVATDIGRDALRDGLRPFLARLVGEPNAQGLLAAHRAATLREAAHAAHAEGDRLYDDVGLKAAEAAWGVATLLGRMADEAAR